MKINQRDMMKKESEKPGQLFPNSSGSRNIEIAEIVAVALRVPWIKTAAL